MEHFSCISYEMTKIIQCECGLRDKTFPLLFMSNHNIKYKLRGTQELSFFDISASFLSLVTTAYDCTALYHIKRWTILYSRHHGRVGFKSQGRQNKCTFLAVLLQGLIFYACMGMLCVKSNIFIKQGKLLEYSILKFYSKWSRSNKAYRDETQMRCDSWLLIISRQFYSQWVL